jgi:hypothetical protein
MKQPFNIVLSLFSFLLVSCAHHEKKILVYASSEIQIDESGKKLTVTEGTTQVEKELDFSGADPVVLTVQSPTGNYSLEAKEDGYYLANLKPDTLVGSFQHVGEVGYNRITQDQLKVQLDSLNQLISGQNVNAASKNYFIPPGHLVKITNEMNAKIFGPYSPIPRGFDASNVPEIYKMYTNAQEREIIAKLKEMTSFKYEVPDKK